MGKKFKQDKGVAGLTILLSLVVMLFVIGLLIMIFSLMGGELQTSTYDELTAGAVQTNETLTTVTENGENLAYYLWRDASCSVGRCVNATEGTVIPATNYTVVGCKVSSVNATVYNNTNWKCSYNWTYSANTTASTTMYDTIQGISETTDWFDIFIVIGAMVVLILLTVIIITAIRSSGMVSGAGSTQGANQVGTA